MSSIFCLETNWDQSIHDMKKESSARPLLEYLKSRGVEYVFRQVATLSEFHYYLNHLSRQSYRRYNTVYLCFHGEAGALTFANGESISLQEIAEQYHGIFTDRKIHFGSCSTLKVPDNVIEDFKNKTKAKLVTGYEKDVPFHDSFLFELWLLHVLAQHRCLGKYRLEEKVEKEMEYYANRLKFKIF